MTGMVARFSAGGHGDGAGRGGGSGGSIRDAGGAFGKMEAAREDEYFYKKQKAQLQELREHIQEEVKHHEGQLENHKKVRELNNGNFSLKSLKTAKFRIQIKV